MKQNTYSAETLQLLNLLGARPIAYHPAFARVWGVKAAVLLGQLLYWHGKQSDPDGWIRKTSAEIDEETALNEREQETARRVLIAVGVVEYKRMGVPAMPHYRINHDAILDALTGKDDDKSAEQDRTKAPDQLGQNVLSSQDVCRGNLIGQNVLSVQEITTETTTEITSEKQQSARAFDADAAARAGGIDKQPPPPRKSRKAQPPAQPTITPEQLSHFAVSAHREIISVLLDAFVVQQIISRVTDEIAWRECLTDWRLHTNWRTDNIAGQLDRYARWAEIKAQSASAPPLKRPEPINGAPAGTLTGAAKIAQETYERQMGGIQSAVEAAMAGGWYGNA